MVLLRAEKNWKEYLTAEDEERLNDLLTRVTKHRAAYRSSDEIKIAQVWCALVELRKENTFLLKKLMRIESAFEGMLGELRKHETEERAVLESLKKL